jgi:hypothetical protein
MLTMLLTSVMPFLALVIASDIKRAHTPPTIDGTLAPGEWDSFFWFYDSDEPPMEGYIANDDQYLYLAFNVTDSTPLGSRDIFYVYVDIPPAGSFNEPKDAFGFGWVYTTTTWTTAYTWFEETTGTYPFNVTRKVGDMPSGVEIVANMQSNARYYEMKIPLEVIGASPGDVIGLKIFARNTGTGAPSTDTINWYPNLPEGITSVYPEARVAVEGNYEHMTLAIGVVYYHDIAVSELTVTPKMVQVGGTVEIKVTVKNLGNATETFDLTTNYGSIAQVEHIVDLEPGDERTFTYHWDTTSESTGVHTIGASAHPVEGETRIYNNHRSAGVAIVSFIPEHAMLKVEPSQAKGLREFKVNVTINELDAYWDMAGFDITLHYNTTMLDVINVELGPFALNYNLTFQIIKEVNDEEGYIHMAYIWDIAHLLPEGRPTPSGSGVLFTITFKVIAEGEDQITFANVVLAAFPNVTKWCTESSIPIEHITEDGTVRTRFPLKEDVNADGKINLLDVVVAATAYASRPGDPNWNPYADLDGDGRITIFDLVKITRIYGITYDP